MRLLTVAVVFIAIANGHCEQIGFCPDVAPMQGFDMNKFLGNWHVIQATPMLGNEKFHEDWLIVGNLQRKSLANEKCLTFNYTQSKEPDKFIFAIGEESDLFGLINHKYQQTSMLRITDSSTPAHIFLDRPSYYASSYLHGGMSHIVFATDYVNYAGIFFCETYLMGPLHTYAVKQHRAMILSRRKSLDKVHRKLLHQKLKSFGIDSSKLIKMKRTDCPAEIFDSPDLMMQQILLDDYL